jgi:hypothetical protein
MLLQVAWQDIGQLPYFRDIDAAFLVSPHLAGRPVSGTRQIQRAATTYASSLMCL